MGNYGSAYSRGSFLALAVPRSSCRRTPAQPISVPIKMAGVPEDSATTVLYAVQSGLFKPYGLDVDMEPQHNGPP